MKPLKVDMVTWKLKPLTDISEAYMVQVNVHRSKQPGDTLRLLGAHSPLNLTHLGYPVIDGVSWLVGPLAKQASAGGVMAEVPGYELPLVRRFLSWHALPQMKPGVQSHEYVDDRGRHLWFEDGQVGTFNSVEELVGAYLCADHWPPQPASLDVAGWLLRHRLEK